jgi:methylmalonyl-CoA/ethylmalonyl-CoA epimerase
VIKVIGLEHVSWAAGDLERSSATLALFGLECTASEEIHAQDVLANAYESDSGLRFEIIRPLGDHSHLHRFLERRGPGLHHVCLQVEDLDQACAEVQRVGWRLTGEASTDSRGRRVFIHPQSTGGLLIGLIELHPHLKPKP